MEARLGSWKVLSTFTKGRRYVVVECKCGSVETRREDHVLSGRTTSCKPCSSKETASKHGVPEPEYKGVGELSATFWHHIERGAKKRELPFLITMEFAWDLFLAQNRRCALSRVPISLSKHASNGAPLWSEISASLDRIDSEYGYTPDNVQWVHKTVNYIKRDLDENEFIDWCSKIGGCHA